MEKTDFRVGKLPYNRSFFTGDCKGLGKADFTRRNVLFRPKKKGEKDSVNLTFIVLTAIVRRVWGCTGFDGCGNACTASECEGAPN